MAYHNSPRITTSGLAAYFDAANIKSYPGQPTVNLIGSQNLTYGVYAYATGPVATSTLLYDNTIGTVNRFTVSQVVNTARSSFAPTVSINQAYTFSCYIRYNGGNTASPTFVISAAKPNPEGGNTIVLSQSTQSQTAVSNNWYRVIYNFTISSNTSSGCILTIGVSTGSDTAYLNNTFDVYQPQLEAKSYATPYVVNTRGTTVATGGGFADLSGNSNNGTLVGDPTYSSTNAGSLVFDGVDDYVDLGTSLSSQFSTQAVTVMAFAKISSVVSKNTLVSFNGAQSFFLPGNRLTTTYQLYWDGTGGWKNGNTSTWVTGQYYHFGWTISGTTLTFYVNGVADGTATVGVFAPTSSTRIGFANAGEYCTGTVGNLKIFNKALSAAEILSNYNSLKTRFGL